jgi:hypothetical protein
MQQQQQAAAAAAAFASQHLQHGDNNVSTECNIFFVYWYELFSNSAKGRPFRRSFSHTQTD